MSVFHIANPKKPDYQLIAWRFTRPMTLPIPHKVTFDLFPLETSGTPTVGRFPVQVGKNIYLTKDLEIQPSNICLIRVYEPVP